ncbi:MAG: FtsX-like permease family protein [Bacteroidales bacterium]|nr:FtsX-like permease family protein [Bacteroidales bacterium]
MLKSYFKFLSRNKAYTAIDVLGLSLSFMFLILIGTYLWQETHVDRWHSQGDRIYQYAFEMNGDKLTGAAWSLQDGIRAAFPEIENSCGIIKNYTSLSSENDPNIRTTFYFTDTSFFEMFDFPLVRGDRNHVLDDVNYILVSENFARKIWGDEDPVGKSLTMLCDMKPMVVTGVFPKFENTAFKLPKGEEIDVIARYERVGSINPSLMDKSNAVAADLFFLVPEGVDLRDKTDKLQEFLQENFWLYRLPDWDVKVKLLPLEERYFADYNSAHGTLLTGQIWMVNVLSIVGILILLFAITNYINLTVAQAAFRAKEMATRRLLGSSRTAIFWRLIVESTLLCTLSLGVGISLAFIFESYAGNLLNTELSIGSCINIATISITFGILIVAGVLAGIIPALLISSNKPIDVVRGTFRRRTKMVFSKIFIIIQNTATILMVAMSITMLMQIHHVINAPLGYNTKDIITLQPWGDKLSTFKKECEKLSCVEKVSLDWGSPFARGDNYTMTYNGKTISIQRFAATPEWMDIYGINVEKERGIEGVYVNRLLLDGFDLDENAESIPLGEGNGKVMIRGIISDIRLGTIEDSPSPIWISIIDNYEQYHDKDDLFWAVSIKTTGDQAEAWRQVVEIGKEILGMDYSELTTTPYLEQKIADRYASEKRLADIVVLFTIIALVISLLGLVAMSTYFVEQRQREIAVRKVFGSDSNGILGRLLWQFGRYILVSFVIACPLIYWLGHLFLAEHTYTISLSWWIYAISGAGCLIVSLLTVLWQSYRAASTNPTRALTSNQ